MTLAFPPRHPGAAKGARSQILTFGRMIKFSHSIFAMPFALAAFFLATRREGFDAEKLFWVIVAMVSARSAAMGFNRWIDAELDASNPRTASHAPTGAMARDNPSTAWDSMVKRLVKE